MAGRGARGGGHRGHPGRRPLSVAPAVPRDRWCEDTGDFYRRVVADRGRRGEPCHAGRAVAVARRVHGRRAAVGIRVSPRTGGRHRAVRGIVAWFLLHFSWHGRRPVAGVGAAGRADRRDRGTAGGEGDRCVCNRTRRTPGQCQCTALCPGTAAGERVQLRAVRRGRRDRRSGTGRGGDGDAGRRGLDAGDADPVRRVGTLGDPAPGARRGARRTTRSMLARNL